MDSRYADSHDTTGETLIPPSLGDFAHTFSEDLESVLGLELEVTLAEHASLDSIFLTVNETAEYLGASGARTAEGYTLTASDSGVVISGASALGVWWGTRTVLQAILSEDGAIPYGESKDAPGWGIRGMMLDAARHYYPPEVRPTTPWKTWSMQWSRLTQRWMSTVPRRALFLHELLQAEHVPRPPQR